MAKWLDLHMHSSYSSDGEIAPEVLMQRCAVAGLKAVALTDHNTTRGVLAGKKAAAELGLVFFPALEIDCAHEGCNLHLLGYGIHADATDFGEIEQDVYTQELAASDKLLELVRGMGLYFNEKLMRAKARNGVITAELIAEVVLNDLRNDAHELLLPFRPGGERSDNPFVNFYWDFCTQGKPAYVPIDYISLAAAVQTIKKNGGVAVLAHPGVHIGKNREMAESIINAGIDGIEVYCNYHDAETAKCYAEICDEYGLIATSGSDYHGKNKPAVHLGTLEHPNPRKVYEQLVQKIMARGGEVAGAVDHESVKGRRLLYNCN